MGCVYSKQKAIFLDQNGQEKVVPRRPSWSERRPGKKERSSKNSGGPPSPVVDDPAPWVKGHAVLTEKDGRLEVIQGTEQEYVWLSLACHAFAELFTALQQSRETMTLC